MRLSLPISFLAHAGILLAGVIVLPSPDSYKVEEQPSIPVDIVEISDVSKRVATQKDAPKKTVDKPAPPKVDQAKITKPAPEPAKEVKVATKEPAPAPEPKVAEKPAPKAEQPPDPKPLEELIKKTEVTPEPKPQPEPKKAEAKPVPLPRVKPKPPADFVSKEKKKKEPAFNPDDIAALLNKVPDKQQAQAKVSDVTGTPLPGKYTSFTGSSDRLSADLVDWLRQQVERCWTPPTGVREAQKLVVRVHFTLNQDGSVLSGPDVLNPVADPLHQAAELSATRAVLMCAPYQGLPLDKYDAWRDVILNFDPSHMLATN